MNKLIAGMGRRVLEGGRLERAEVLSLVSSAREDPYDLLYWAQRLRTRHFGRAVKLCSIVPGKLGRCGEDCKWCAQSTWCGSGPSGPLRTAPDEIVTAAKQAAQWGSAGFGIVNSGCRPADGDVDAVIDAAARITAACDIQLCASLGELTDEQADRLAAAGISRYNHNLETSRNFYPQVVTKHTYDDRLRTLRLARRAGLGLCCGGIFGIGESWEDRIDLALTLRDQVQPASVPLNFLVPIVGTPLERALPLQPIEILTIIAVFRLVLPTVDLKIAGGREVNLRDMQSWIFHAGATSILVGNYLTTPGRSAEDDLRMLADLGLTVVSELPAPLLPTPA